MEALFSAPPHTQKEKTPNDSTGLAKLKQKKALCLFLLLMAQASSLVFKKQTRQFADYDYYCDCSEYPIWGGMGGLLLDKDIVFNARH